MWPLMVGVNFVGMNDQLNCWNHLTMSSPNPEIYDGSPPVELTSSLYQDLLETVSEVDGGDDASLVNG